MVNEFAYLGFEGVIDLGIGRGKDWECNGEEGGRKGEIFTIFEEFGPPPPPPPASDSNQISDAASDGAENDNQTSTHIPGGAGAGLVPTRLFLARHLGISARETGILSRYTLKKRHYINTTSMDAELAFLTANITLAAPGKWFWDPFCGTGGLPLACAHFGAVCGGGDIDGRMLRGKDIEGGRGGEGS